MGKKKLHKAGGPLQDCYEIFKLAGDTLQPCILGLCNLYFVTGRLPKHLIACLMTLIHKGGAKEEVKNHRPISLAGGLVKIYESLLKERATQVLTENKLPHPAQHACILGAGSLYAEEP